MLRQFIEHDPQASHATKLQTMLTKTWSEEPNAYKIRSKITPSMEKRIKSLLNEDRYS
jgi:hypothetical protein